jgi:hypothetical protein
VLTGSSRRVVWNFWTANVDLDILNQCVTLGKRWIYQKVRSAHRPFRDIFEGRISLHIRASLQNLQLTWPDCIFSEPDEAEIQGPAFFELPNALGSVVGGPWMSRGRRYVPLQVRQMRRDRPWQAELKRMTTSPVEHYDFRTIHCIVDPVGNNGKTSMALKLEVNSDTVIRAPYMTNFKDIIRLVTNKIQTRVAKRGRHDKYVVLFDLPRSAVYEKKELRNYMAGVEEVKNGTLWDDRYKLQEVYIDPPIVFVFCNALPPVTMLSQDRWKFWTITNEGEQARLVPYVPPVGQVDPVIVRPARSSEEVIAVEAEAVAEEAVGLFDFATGNVGPYSDDYEGIPHRHRRR